MDKYKEIHIGAHIRDLVNTIGIDSKRICKYFKCYPSDLEDMFNKKSMEADFLLKWSKLLNYNLFTFYYTHLQLYAPSASMARIKTLNKKEHDVYNFKKNYYSPELKDFIINLIINKDRSIIELIRKYNIPKTTIYRWLKKYNQQNENPENRSENKVKHVKSLQISHTAKLIAFKLLYKDVINDLELQDEDLQRALLEEADRLTNYTHISLLNNKIKQLSIITSDPKAYQQLKSYDYDKIISILKYQRDNKLSNLDTANEFKMSRNTLTRWWRFFGQLV